MYYFWKAPTNGLPEFTGGGHGVTVIPGMGQFVLLHKSVRDIPKEAISVERVIEFLNQQT
jgi:hypothetical protein